MSKDQLGWDAILKKSEPADEPQKPVEPEIAAPEKTKPARAKKSVKEEPTSYAKKNWGKLEFPTSASNSAPEVAKTGAPIVTEVITTASEKITIIAEPVRQPAPPPRPARDEAPSSEPEVISVSDLNKHIRNLLEGEFPLLWLKGEISNFKAHTSGHFYFSLKDSKAQISAVMFRGFNSGLRFRPEDGMEVIVRGKVTVYEPRGNYQLFCELMEPVGAGALQKAFEQLKTKLQKEGLFDEARKRPLPALPKHIAIVTSPTGAAIRDMLNVLSRRFKGARITIVPCKVQGDQAPTEIVAAIRLANQLPDVDVMICGRGGGSIEDLWAFNDERVARAIAASHVPTISAVGHEIDFTIADFVADLRAPTPSAAAELVVKNAADLTERILSLTRALRFAILRHLNSLRQTAVAHSRRLVDPQRRIQDASLRCDELLQRLEAMIGRTIQMKRQALPGLQTRLRTGMRTELLHRREIVKKNMALLDSLSPLRVLDRGYSMVQAEGKVVTDAAMLKTDQTVRVRMGQGAIEARVLKIEKENK